MASYFPETGHDIVVATSPYSIAQTPRSHDGPPYKHKSWFLLRPSLSAPNAHHRDFIMSPLPTLFVISSLVLSACAQFNQPNRTNRGSRLARGAIAGIVIGESH